MNQDLVTTLLPIVGRSLELGFNVFEVMHHGLHEKQLSNVFRWLLDAQGTHDFGDTFARIFIEEVNRLSPPDGALPLEGYWVKQEVNTSTGDGADIADLVLESETARVVIENYFTSDGHGHSYSGYLNYSRRGGRQGAVVLLCRDLDRSLQTNGWENAPVLTYGQLVQRLLQCLSEDPAYRVRNPEAHSFIDQMHRKFVKGRGHMEERDVLGFVVAMCETGQAKRYQEQRQEVAAEQFANELAEQAKERFGEGRELLQRVKARLKSYCAQQLVRQLNATLGEGSVRGVSAGFKGIYQWTINFAIDDSGAVDFGEAKFQLKFGPSAWFANGPDPNWTLTVDPDVADYTRIFLTRAGKREVRQSTVTLQEVLDGLRPDDMRLHDEIVEMLREPTGLSGT